jgi:hypothetical protein
VTFPEGWLALLADEKPDSIPADIWATAEVIEKLKKAPGCQSEQEIWKSSTLTPPSASRLRGRISTVRTIPRLTSEESATRRFRPARAPTSKTMHWPRYWQDDGYRFSGVFWFRREVKIPARWAGCDLMLNLCPCDKQDTTYFDNERVAQWQRRLQTRAGCAWRPARGLAGAARPETEVNGHESDPSPLLRFQPIADDHYACCLAFTEQCPGWCSGDRLPAECGGNLLTCIASATI